MRAFFLLALLCASARAQAQTTSTATVRLALIEPAGMGAQSSLSVPLERLLKTSSAAAALVDIQEVPCYHSGSDFRLRLPPSDSPLSENSFSTMAAVALASDSESALIFPPDPDLVAGMRRLAEDPATFQLPLPVRVAETKLIASQTLLPDGQALVTAQLDPQAGEGAQWLSGFAQLYRLRWHGQNVSVVVMAKFYGGMGRLASALEREKAGGPFLGVARSDVFGDAENDLKGRAMAEKLESLGLSYAAVGSAEIRRWRELQDYRRDRPTGIQFLSANLVYANSPAATLLPDHAVVDVGGTKVCLVGMTPPEAAKFMGQGGLKGAVIADPVQAFQARSAGLHKECGLVVLLGALTPESERLRHEAYGADIIVGEDYRSPYYASERGGAQTAQHDRRDYDAPLWVAKDFRLSLNVLEVGLSSEAGRRSLSLRERHILLDESIPWSLSFPPYSPEDYATTLSTTAPMIPSARLIFSGNSNPSGFPEVGEDDFWSMAASFLAHKTGSEAGLLRLGDLPIRTDTDLPEAVVRRWLYDEEPALIVYLKGSTLKGLLAEAKKQRERRATGLPHGPGHAFVAGGVDQGSKVHGVDVDDRQIYRVATTQVLIDALGLSSERPPDLVGKTADEIVLEALRERRGAPPSDYARWMKGEPVSRPGLWKLHVRDLGLNITDTQVVRPNDFDSVPNSRIQGFSQFVVGGDLKADADYLKTPYKWSNTLELEYAQSQLSPRNRPHIINTPANRIMALTMLTRRAGGIPQKWLAQSWGPSAGFEYDSEFVPSPGLPRKQVYSAFPGVEFFDGTVVRKWDVTANFKREQSRNPPNTQGGLHTRLLLSKEWGPAPVSLQGEFYSNYFFLTRRDTAQDLRFEADFNLKLKIPIKKHLTVAPFFDVYVFQLKVTPASGYSAMTGVSIAFSRLWKPQYEGF